MISIIGKKKNFPSHSRDCTKFEQNNKTITLNILFVPYNTEKIRLAYKSKHNFKRENQVILLMITDGKKWRYLNVKSVPALLREKYHQIIMETFIIQIVFTRTEQKEKTLKI